MSDSFDITCPNCGAENKNPPMAGQLAICQYCGAGIPVVGEAPAALPEAASWIDRQLPKVEEAIDQLEPDLKTDPARLKEAARKVWLQAQKKKDGDWDEVAHELGYLAREAKTIFDAAAGYLVDARSEVKDYIEPLIAKTRESADARPLFETVQSFGQAMAEAQGGALPENLDDFQAPPFGAPTPPPPPFSDPTPPPFSPPAPARRLSTWQIAVGLLGAGCCLCCGAVAVLAFFATRLVPLIF